MKLTLTLFVLLNFNAFAITYAQDTKIDLSVRDESFEKILKEIKKQSDFKFLYQSDLFEGLSKMSIEADDLTISEIFTRLIGATEYEYEVNDNTVVFRKKNTPKTLELQREPIKGKVTDEKGEGLPGATVAVKGTTRGTITDVQGEFALNIVDGDEYLIISFVGYQQVEMLIGNQSELNVSLKPDMTSLEEIVVVGYGTQRKTDLTSAVVSVKSDNFIQGSVRDAGQLLQGKVAGLTIGSPSGDPTAQSQIVLRGTATLSSSTAPLILVDGIPGDLNTVAPEDIESIDVLKDGSAAAIYGTRGTNGVILITTKKPAGGGQPTIDYHGYVSTQSFWNLPKMLTAGQYRELAATNPAYAGKDLGASTDWMKAVSRDFPLSQVHNLSFKNGNASTNYLATLTYRDFEGIFLKSNNRNINGRVDINHNMIDNKLKINLNLLTRDNRYNSLGNNSSFDNTIFRQAIIRNPTAPIKNADGTWHEQVAIASYENPLALIRESNGQYESQTSRVSGSVTVEPVEGLHLKALVSRQRTDYNYGYSESKQNISTTRDNLQGVAIKSGGEQVDQLMELTGEYVRKIGTHNFSILGGYSYQDQEVNSSNIENFNFPSGDFSYVDNIQQGSAISEGNGTVGTNRYRSNLIGFFGRATYNLNDKYLLMTNLRYEASSRFVGTNKPWVFFPSISAGWRISNEDFMKSVPVVSNLKLRVGYGETGTAPDQLFLGVPRLSYASNQRFLINGEWVSSLSPTSNPNPYLRWEIKKETNIGLDFGLFEGRIAGTVDYYIRRTTGLIQEFNVPTPPNAANTTMANAGVMENKGLEILVQTSPVRKGKFIWNSSVNFSTNKNTLKKLSNDIYKNTNDFLDKGYTGSPIQTTTHRIQEGEPIGNFYGYKVVDINEDGKWVYLDTAGQETLKELTVNKRVIGNGLPNFYAGWNNDFSYGRFELGITMRGAFDYQIVNYHRMYYENPTVREYNQLKSANDLVFGKAVLDAPLTYNSYYVEDGDFWKIDNITLGYNFDLTRVKHISRAKVYVSTLNTFTFTKYKGMDPEVNRSGLTPGLDERDKYPSTRVYSIGVNLSFK